MRKKFKVQRSEFKGNMNIILHASVFLLLTFCFPLSYSFADDVNSRAIVVMDKTGKILYAKNPNLRLAPASTTKLMTAILAVEMSNLSDVVTISRNAANVSPHKAGFRVGDKVTMKTLLYAALLGSANDAAVALSEAVAGSEERFVDLMNSKAAEIGLRDTRFINPHGLPGSGQWITAYDLAEIMSYALRHPILKEIIGTRVAEVSTEKGNAIFLRNTNRLLWSDDDLVGGKTGYTRKARHCFVCAAERDRDTVIVAVLGSPSRESLWQETELMVQKGFRMIANKEEPDIYFAKADYDDIYIKKASYRKSLRLKTGKKLIAKKTTGHRKTKVFAKKKTRTKRLAKTRNHKEKNFRVADKVEVGSKG
jgi:serine-type D-Ala-D-Ala carboxypeptidase (penicillin-binding protein 5/6)